MISRSALRLNLRAVLSTQPDAAIDVRADGWGHGLGFVAQTALECGVRALIVDEEGRRELDGVVPAAVLVSGSPSAIGDPVYGLSAGFIPVLSLRGRVLGLKELKTGEAVSYGYTFRTPRDTVIALVTGGYAQGVLRALGNAVTVRIAGERHPIVGRVAMDVCVVDVGPRPRVRRGDEVTFFDESPEGPAVAEWAAAGGLTPAEIACAVGLRNHREYLA